MNARRDPSGLQRGLPLAYYPDLSPCDYFDQDPEGKLFAVGWLEGNQPFATGEVDRPLLDALTSIVTDPWKVFSYRGFHSCSFRHRRADFPGNELDQHVGPLHPAGRHGVHNLFVPGRRRVYAARELILHYIHVHGYAPPKVFQRAMLACPEVRSERYLKAIIRSGPSWLAEEARAELDRPS
jgi:hypothetical protein